MFLHNGLEKLYYWYFIFQVPQEDKTSPRILKSEFVMENVQAKPIVQHPEVLDSEVSEHKRNDH